MAFLMPVIGSVWSWTETTGCAGLGGGTTDADVGERVGVCLGDWKAETCWTGGAVGKKIKGWLTIIKIHADMYT